MVGDTKKWDTIKAAVKRVGKAHVKVGVLAANGGAATDDGITMVELAAIHEFGAPGAGIPERSFIRSTFKVHKTKELANMQAKLAQAIILKDMPVKQALGLLGTWATAQVKRTISGRLVRPQLEESEAGRRTIARKGSSTTLVDTGRLINAISFEVSDGEPGTGK